MKDGRFERIHVNENAVRSLNGRKSAYTTLHHRFAVSQCKWLFSILAGRYEWNNKKEDKLLNVDDQKRCLNWPRTNGRMIHVPCDEILEKRNKKGLVRVINENNNSLRCEKLYGSESHNRVTGNNLNSVSLVVIYRLNGPTAIDRALRVNSRTLRRLCKLWGFPARHTVKPWTMKVWRQSTLEARCVRVLDNLKDPPWI